MQLYIVQKLEKMKIAIFLMDLSGGGAERVMLNLAQGFLQHNVNLDLVLVKSVGSYTNQIPQGVNLVCLNAPRLAASLPLLINYLKEARPTVLVSALEDTNFIALTAIKLASVSTRSIVTVHNNLSRESKNSSQLKRRLTPYLVKFFYSWADAVVGVSNGVVQDLIRIGISKEKVVCIYNPIVTNDLVSKAQAPIDHPWFKAKSIPVVVGVGRLTKQKDFSTLIRAIAMVNKDSPVRLMLLGEGEEKPYLEQIVEQLGLSDDVTFCGFVDNPYAYMEKADLLVLSSAWEGFGNVLVESMAVGTPVVSTNCDSGPSEILGDGRYGRLVPVGHVEDLAKAIKQTFENPLNPEILKKRANEFTLEQATERYLHVMEGLGSVHRDA